MCKDEGGEATTVLESEPTGEPPDEATDDASPARRTRFGRPAGETPAAASAPQADDPPKLGVSISGLEAGGNGAIAVGFEEDDPLGGAPEGATGLNAHVTSVIVAHTTQS